MTSPIPVISYPVIDLAAATAPDAPKELLDQIREATETIGIIQVLNHGVPKRLISEFDQRIGRLLGLPRDRKAELTSPTGHPYRGWRQWPDDFGRLELERFNVGQFDNVDQARAAGLAEEYVGLYAHDNVWPSDDPGLRDLTFRYIAAGQSVAERVLGLYARAQGLPDGTFPVSPLPYLSFTVNNYPTWTYPDTGNDEDKLLLLEHADGSAVTVLAQGGDYEGLQVQPLAPFVEPGEETDYEPVTQWELVKGGVENYLKVFGRPAQVTAWREGKPYVAELAENSAGR